MSIYPASLSAVDVLKNLVPDETILYLVNKGCMVGSVTIVKAALKAVKSNPVSMA